LRKYYSDHDLWCNRPGDDGGGSRVQRMHDTRLMERALRESWPIPDDLRPSLVRRLAYIMTSDNSSPREITSAAKALLSASKCNLDAVNVAMQADTHENITERLKELEKRMPPCP
jgi:hypothetical protein